MNANDRKLIDDSVEEMMSLFFPHKTVVPFEDPRWTSGRHNPSYTHFSRGNGQTAHREGDEVVVRTPSYKFVPLTSLQQELKDLMDSWRRRGYGQFTHAVEQGQSEETVYDQLGDWVIDTWSEQRFPIDECEFRFYERAPLDAAEPR